MVTPVYTHCHTSSASTQEFHSHGSVAGGDASLAAIPGTEDLSPAGPSQPTHALPEPESDTHAGHSAIVHVASDATADQAMQQLPIAANETILQPFQHVKSDTAMHVAMLHPDNADLSALRHQLDQPAAVGVAMQLQTQPPASSLLYSNTEAASLSAKPSKECVLDPAVASASCSNAQPNEQSRDAILPATQNQAVLETWAQQPARQPVEPSDASAVGGPPGTTAYPQPAHEPDGAEATPVLQMLTDLATAELSSVPIALPVQSQDDGKCDAASAGPASMAHLTASDSQAPSAISNPSGPEHQCVAREGAVFEVHAQHVEVRSPGDAQCSAFTQQDSNPLKSSAEAQSSRVGKDISMHNVSEAAARPPTGGQPSLPLSVAPQHTPEQDGHSIHADGPPSRPETDVKLLGCAAADTSAAHIQRPLPSRNAVAEPAASKAVAQQQQQQPQAMSTEQQQQQQQPQAMSTEQQQQQQQQPQAVSTKQQQPQAMSAQQQMTRAGPVKQQTSQAVLAKQQQTQAESTKQAHAVLTRQPQQRTVTVRQQQPRAILTRQQRQLLGSEQQQQQSSVAVRHNSRWPDAKVTSMSLRSKKRKHDSWSSDQDVGGDSTGVIGGSEQRRGAGSYATRSRVHMPSVVSPEHRCADARSDRVRYASI